MTQISVALLTDPRPSQRARAWIRRTCELPYGADLRLTHAEYRDLVWVAQTETGTDPRPRGPGNAYFCGRRIVVVPENDEAPAPKGGQ